METSFFKRKADDLEAETKKKAKKVMTTEELAEKELRTIFVGNLPVECIEKVKQNDTFQS